ncbi:MAG: lipid-A-disaccharide synthase [Chlamydiales bacterium]
MTTKKLFLFAGEQSGDLLGAQLIQAIKSYAPSLQLEGVGGSQMQTCGMEDRIDRFQVMGFSDVLKALPRLYQELNRLKKDILKRSPDAVVFIDYPDFSMRLARALRKQGYRGKLIHYVCPSVWAWRKNRIETLAKTLDLLLTILPFEPALFSHTSLTATYVGHPLIAAIDHYSYRPNWKKNSDERPILALFPGSRPHEIALNLPLQLKAALDDHQIAISVARPDLEKMIKKIAPSNALLVPAADRYELMHEASMALATSGTVVLELGLHQVPTVVTYKMAPLNYLLGRYIFRIHLPYYTLVNLICQKEVYPEFIHRKICSDKISQALKKLKKNENSCRLACQELKKVLLAQDASLEAARAIERTLGI